MSERDDYRPGSARGAAIQADGDSWALTLVRELSHAPEVVWKALTDPAQLRAWAPFDADRDLAGTGPVKLSTVGGPTTQVSETTVRRAEPPRLLEYDWGQQELKWELEPTATGTRLRLWHKIDRRFISMGAAGWHICFDVLTRFLSGAPIGRIVGAEAMKFEWPRLNAEYAAQFGVEALDPPMKI